MTMMKILAGVLLSCGIVYGSDWVNPATQQEPPFAYEEIRANFPNADASVLLAKGWRRKDPTPVPPVAAGCERVSARWVQDPERPEWAVFVVVDQSIAERQERERQARLASFQPLIPKAAVYKAILRKHFGGGAETNRDVTATAVEAYFVQKEPATAGDLKDAVLLKELFAVLSVWNGGETWTLPWGVVP